MARRKKHKSRRRTHRRMSGISGIKNIDFQNIAGVVGGALIAGYANKLLGNVATTNPKAVAGGKVVLGVALPMFMKNRLGQGLGAGMVAVGSVDLLRSFGVITRDFDIPVVNGDEFGEDILGADFDIPVVNGDEFGEDVLGANEFGEDVLGEDDDTM